MTIITDKHSRSSKLSGSAAGVKGAPAMPVKLWASIGIVVIGVIINSLWMWVTSDHFKPSPVGIDPLPTVSYWLIRAIEVVSTLGGLLLIWHCIIKPWRREGELSWDGMLCIVAFSLWIQDPMDNYFNFGFSYNAHFINLSSWTTYLPGWESPRMENFPEPLFLMGGMYIIFLCGFVLLGCQILNKSKTSWFPNSSILVHIMVVFAIFFMVDLIVESIFCRYELFAYGGTYHPLTLWAGEYYQFPLYESMCVGGIVTTLTVLRYFKDDFGFSFAEKGIQHTKLGKKGKKLVAFLSILGFAHTAMFVVFFFPFNWFTMKADSYPQTSSYIRFEVCGKGTPYACPSREVPVPSKTSLAIGPEDPRLSNEAKRN
ncbi:MAG: hypothetical protein ACI9CE_003382 [Flavobacterium sp.]|jgi:hypothetical protein